MQWIVTYEMRDGPSATVEVSATNKSDAEYRAGMKIEAQYGVTERVIAARKVGR